MRKSEAARFGIVGAVVLILYLVLTVRLFYWQTVRAEHLSDLGKQQSSETLNVPAIRGKILSSDNFPLAANTISYMLYSNPKLIEDKKYVADKIAPILKEDSASISALLSRNLFWVKLSQNLDDTAKKQIDDLRLKGLGFEQEYSRFYPEASMAAHLIGFLGRDENGARKGYFGVEGQYNDQLSGRDGARHAIRDALGNQILNDIREDKKIDGRNIRLTIDRSVQFIVDQKLSDGVTRYNADGGSAIVMDSKTGQILAMASYPDFDPNKYYEQNPDIYTNPVLSELYEPGSTFKVLVMASALDQNLVTPNTRCDICASSVQVGEYKIKTWNDQYFPNTTMEQVIVHSDNTGMVYVGRKLGVSRMVDYLTRFGFGTPTGVDLQGEATGIVRDKDSWHEIDLATSSFGQGISVTPIQLITAVNSIANKGQLMAPYVVSQILTDDGRTIDIKPKTETRTVSEAAALTTASMMVDAVENGEAKWTKINNYQVAGKTGTAQIPVAGHYDPNQTVASFVGFFPAYNPKVTMLVLLNRPKTSIYGAETAAPIFFSIARDLIKYYNLPSDK